jgi:hypothetical protein
VRRIDLTPKEKRLRLAVMIVLFNGHWHRNTFEAHLSE